MSIAAAQASAFGEEVVASEHVWAIRDAGGFPAPINPSGERAMPFWSCESRALSIIGKVPAYRGFVPHRLSLAEFVTRWLPRLEEDGVLVGLNWSGQRATGYDISPAAVRVWIDNARAKREERSG